MERAIVSPLSPIENGTLSEVIDPVLLLSFVSALFLNVALSVFNFVPTNSTPSANILCQVHEEKNHFHSSRWRWT